MIDDSTYRLLGKSGTKVSPLCLGTMTFGTPVDERAAIGLVHAALDLGINFIDTADIYEGYKRQLGSPGGEAEHIVGRALVGRRQRAVITTKVGNSVGTGPDLAGLGRAHIRRQIDSSLRRLKTDYVDIYELHRPDPSTEIEETLAVVSELLAEGKVRFWGYSNFPAELIVGVLAICDRNGVPRPVVCQPLYNWLNREIETGLQPLCLENDIAITPYQPLQGGVLTGKYRAGVAPPEGSRAIEQARWLPNLDPDLFGRIREFEREAENLGRSPLQHALKWLLDRPSVASVVVGCKSVDQLTQLVEAAI
jgi:aryl-alcohol dehydrogenase-like predicted oxidoreductase